METPDGTSKKNYTSFFGSSVTSSELFSSARLVLLLLLDRSDALRLFGFSPSTSFFFLGLLVSLVFVLLLGLLFSINFFALLHFVRLILLLLLVFVRTIYFSTAVYFVEQNV